MADLDRVILAASEVALDRRKVMEWLEEPLAAFRGKTPLQLVAEGQADDLLAYIASVESGFVG
ncbi:antitoxin Xre/MbcA/ParS toxin-binding domain-containing protein [Dyella solisilvae]|nr:antitoxin Xre/MbcA/ParS toxin-binding domain-containing protein [Dyella solisilvae]